MTDRAAAPPFEFVIAPGAAAAYLRRGGVRVVDLRKPEARAAGHVPGAVPLDYASLVREDKPVGGLLPDDAALGAVFSALGLAPGQPVIAYDDEGNGRASRLVWTLNAIGPRGAAILDGGFAAWLEAGLPARTEAAVITPTHYRVHTGGDVVADRAWLLAHLDDPDVVVLDTRSEKEYRGEDFAVRPAEEVDLGEIRLSSGGQLIVDVRGADGQPVAGASLTIRRKLETTAAADPMFKEILDSQTAYMKMARRWTEISDYAYLKDNLE